MRKRKKRRNPLLIVVLGVLILVFTYINAVVVPATPPLFVNTPTPTTAPESYVRDAEQAFQEGRLVAAIDAYQQAILADPGNRANYVALARVQVWAGKYEDALKNAELSLLGNENYALGHAVRGWVLNFLGQSLDAEGEIQLALDAEPDNPLFLAYQAEILMDKNDFGVLEDAIAASRRAVDLGPTLFEAHRVRGYVLLYTSNYQEALDEFEVAKNINSKIPELFLHIGRAYRALGDYPHAIKAFEAANALNPTDDIPDTEMARTYAQEGQFGNAILSAQAALRDAPTNPYRYGNLGLMYYKNNEYPKAIENLAIAIHGGTTPEGYVVEGLPLDYGFPAQYYYTYGLALARSNHCVDAIPIFRALLTVVSADETAVFNANEGLSICGELEATPAPTP
ncbi:MAG: hypothetical protein Fur0018_02300 [Anaerolineales bacterium]